MAAVMQPYMNRQLISGGVVLVRTKDKIVDLEAFGYSDVANKVPMKTDNVFWIASMSKASTTACLMMLVDEGKVNVNDPVEKYLPEFKGQMVVEANNKEAKLAKKSEKKTDKADEVSIDNLTKDDESGASTKVVAHGPAVPPSHPITVREAMSHTASLPENIENHSHMLDDLSIEKNVKLFASEPLYAQPGTKFLYSNEGIYIAARIVEVVSGMPYEKFLQQRLLDPLGMKDTTYYPSPAQVARLAKSYGTEGGKLTENPCCNTRLTLPLWDHTHRFPNPAGGLFSTATDIGIFMQMLENGGTYDGKRLLSEAAVKAMTTKETPDGVDTTYGFGMYQTDEGFRHGGAQKTEMYANTQNHSVRVLMVQRVGPWPGKVGPEMEDALKQNADAMVAAAAAKK